MLEKFKDTELASYYFFIEKFNWTYHEFVTDNTTKERSAEFSINIFNTVFLFL